MEHSKDIVVIGAGVVGLTTAVKLQETGCYQVTVLSGVFPTDPKTVRYTSFWAGAQHASSTSDQLRHKLEDDTFDVMWPMSAPGAPTEKLFGRVTYKVYGREKPNPPNIVGRKEDFDFKILSSEELPADRPHGYSYTTLTIDVPKYISYLLSRFVASGGILVRGDVQHLSQVIDGGAGVFAGRKAVSSPDAVIVCAGLGARVLGGVEDTNVFPIRGQTVVLKAPWVKNMYSDISEDGWHVYVIPRGASGDIILGGIFDEDDWYPVPIPAITEKILKNGLERYPELAPPDITATRSPTVDDLQPIVVDVGCGLRPARRGGVRIETETKWKSRDGKYVPVIMNYGHGSFGFQSSWGSANLALDLLKKELAGK